MASVLCAWTFNACTLNEPNPQDATPVPAESETGYAGLFVLNEGLWGQNNASIDFLDFAKGNYVRDLFLTRNPDLRDGLGDVGNDLQVYDHRAYAVINGSNLIEVMDTAARHIGCVYVDNPRYVAFKDNYGYVTTYTDYVYRFDLATLKKVDSVHVGFQPDGLAIVGTELYAANSGGYLYPGYDSTLSVVDLNSMSVTEAIKVYPNLFQVVADSHDQLWVSGRGNYMDIPSALCCIDRRTRTVVDTLDIRVDDLWLDGDDLYVIAAGSFKVVDVATRTVKKDNFITDGTDTDIQTPYGLLVHPDTKRIYMTDVRYYTGSGKLYCYTPDGQREWTVTAADMPGHLALVK